MMKVKPPDADELLAKSIEAIHAGHAALVAEAMRVASDSGNWSKMYEAMMKADMVRAKALDGLFAPPVPPLG
jgi:hypothetical protein